MIKPEKIIEQIQQGLLPTTWRVFRGKGHPVASAILSGIFTGIFVALFGSFCAFFGAVTGVLSLFNSPTSVSNSSFPVPDGSSSSPIVYPTSDPGTSIFSPFLQAGGLVLLVAVLIGALVAVLVYNRSRRTLNSLLVITPEGVVECAYYQQPQKRQWKVLDFATVNSLKLRVNTSTHTDMSTNTTHTRPSFWLDVQQRDGTWTRWPLDARFDRPEAIAQYIIEAHTRFML
jgi:hypothetical protein